MPLAELKTADVAAGAQALTRGYATDGDGGGGVWIWIASSTATPDDVFVVQKTGTSTGRWHRLYDGRVNVKWFGAKGDGVTNDSTAIQAAIDTGLPVFFPYAIYKIDSPLTFKVGGPTILIGERSPGLQGGGTSIIASWTTGDYPMLGNPAGWKEFDGSFTDGTNPLTSAGDLTAIGHVRIDGIEFLAHDSNTEGTCVQIYKGVSTHIANCRFRGRRGLETGLGMHDVIVLNSQASSQFVSQHDWTEPVDVTVLRRNCGFLVSGHACLYGVTAMGCGTGIYICGNGSNIFGARIEVCGYGMAVGYTRDTPTGTENYPLARATVSGISMEACYIGLSVNNLASGASIENVIMQGSPSAEGRDYDAKVGMEVFGIGISCDIRNVAPIGTFTLAAIVNYSEKPLKSCFATNNNGTATKLGAAFRPLGRSDSGADPEVYHFLNTELFPWATKQRHKTITAFHDLMLPGLTGINIRDLGASGDSQGGPVFSRNLGGVETLGAAATTKAVAFETALGAGHVLFNSGPSANANASSSLAADIYYYATTVIGKHGEVGVNYTNASANNYKTVTIGTDEEAVMGYVDYSARGTRRIYRGTALGEFDGYWEVTGTSFTDNGTQAFDGYGMPPKFGGLPARTEDDANYQIVATPSWDTTVWVTGQATTGFTLNFGTATPDANQTVSWLLFRP